jgi:hypothetical protein
MALPDGPLLTTAWSSFNILNVVDGSEAKVKARGALCPLIAQKQTFIDEPNKPASEAASPSNRSGGQRCNNSNVAIDH